MPHELGVAHRSHLCLYSRVPYLSFWVFSSQIHTRLSFFPADIHFSRMSTLCFFLKIRAFPKFGCEGESCWPLVPSDVGNWRHCDSWPVLPALSSPDLWIRSGLRICPLFCYFSTVSGRKRKIVPCQGCSLGPANHWYPSAFCTKNRHVQVVRVLKLEGTGNALSGFKTRAFHRTFQKGSYLFPTSIPLHPCFSFLLSTAFGCVVKKDKIETFRNWSSQTQPALDFGIRDKPPRVSWTWLLPLWTR